MIIDNEARIMAGKALSDMAEIARYLSTPDVSYVHSGNKQVVVSAVDVNTDIFTAAAHGLANGDIVFPVMNADAGNIYPLNVYAGGLTYKGYPGYYVGSVTANTFKLYTDAALTTVVDITANANMDLTKWHFEVPVPNMVISNINGLKKVRVLVRGRTLRSLGSYYLMPNAIDGSQNEWLSNGSTAYGNADLASYGDIAIDLDLLIDYNSFLTIKARGLCIRSATASTVSNTVVDRMMKSPKYRAGSITSLSLTGFYLANGTTVEVYKA
jgi:hypothetical protein